MAYRLPGYQYGSNSYYKFRPALGTPGQQHPTSKPPLARSVPRIGVPRPNGSTPPLSKRVASSRHHVHSTSSSQSSLSSTPHAPRLKKPLPFPVPHHGEGGTFPSTHELIKRHSYLNESLIKGLTSPSHEERGGREKVEGGEVTGDQRKQAWGEETVQSPRESRVMQPFRRVYSVHKAPEGVPPLDLSQLNEPDENMQPVELLSCEEEVEHETHRSEMSWGMPPAHRAVLTSGEKPTVQDDLTVQDELTLQDVTEETDRQQPTTEAAVEEMHTRLDASQVAFVEQKVLSHERSRPAPPSPSPREPPGVFGTGGLTATKLPPEALRSHMTLGMGTAEAALSKRVRFEARVLTQNGRDIHRELCGFYFLADGSLTIYEFRQFGKKSSALPLVQRGVYCHMVGHREGQPYQINYIRKGATLHFRANDHPSLPGTMKRRPLVSFRITHVDESTKRNLLCVGRNPMECRSIESYLGQPLSPSEEKENNLLRTLQGMICSRLRGRASRTLVGLGRHLGQGGTAVVGRTQLAQALQTFHIGLTQEDFAQLWRLLCAGTFGPPDGGGVYMEGCVGALVGEMGEERKALVRKVFQKLDSYKSGAILMSDMCKFFNASRHPDVVAGRRTAEGAWFRLFGYLQTSAGGNRKASISYANPSPKGIAFQNIVAFEDFEHYYEGISIETASDSDFCNLLRNCWTI